MIRASRLIALTYSNAGGVLGNLTYQYNAAGNRTQLARRLHGARKPIFIVGHSKGGQLAIEVAK